MKKIIDLAPYYMKLHVEITDDICEKMSELTHDDVIGSGLACCIDYDIGDAQYILLLDPSATIDIITHEALHIVNMLFRDKGIKWSYNNDEPAAYMLGWLTNEIQKVVYEKR